MFLSAKEQIFYLGDQKIAAKMWNDPSGIPTLAVHGWLDNAASFDRLAPLLPECHIIAIDLPGHGFSDYTKGITLHIIDYVVTIIQIVNQLGWEKLILLGHSWGAGISSLVAGTCPSRIQALLLIDGLGPLTTAAEETPQQLRQFVEELKVKPNKSAPCYPTQEDALIARLKVNEIQADPARLLIQRGTKQLPNGQWTWRTDPKLLMPSPLQLTEEQTLAFLKNITSPVCIIRPDPGFPFVREIVERRLKAVPQAKVLHLPGQHHIHLDDPVPVAHCLQGFIRGI